MTVTTQPVALDPYDYAFQEDPYPVYARLRAEQPLHHPPVRRAPVVGPPDEEASVVRPSPVRRAHHRRMART